MMLDADVNCDQEAKDENVRADAAIPSPPSGACGPNPKALTRWC